MSQHYKNIAIVGASGYVGKPTLSALIKHGKHNITAITRSSSTATFPSSVNVKRGEYKDAEFMHSALQGQDVLIIMLAFAGLPDQSIIIEAAGKAGVKHVLPSDYGIDKSNPRMMEHVTWMGQAADQHKAITQQGMKWTSVTTNSWIDYNIEYETFGIHPRKRQATLYTDSYYFNMSTTALIGEAIARMLSLPVDTLNERFGNNFLYVSSFRLTHPELFEAVLRATGTSEADWKIERKTIRDMEDTAKEKMRNGDSTGAFELLFAATFTEGLGGDYNHKVQNGELGLEQEDLDEVVKAAVEKARHDVWDAGTTLNFGTPPSR